MSCCCDCFEVETIQHIYDSQTVDDGNGNDVPRDVIYEAMAGMTNDWDTYAQQVHDRIWQDMRYRMIGSCDVDMWVQMLTDRMDAVFFTNMVRFDMTSNEITNGLHVGGTETRVYGERTDSGEGVSEDMPDTSSTSTAITYPSSKSQNKNTKGEQTDTITDMGSSAEHLKDTYEAIRDPFDWLMKDLESLWLNAW